MDLYCDSSASLEALDKRRVGEMSCLTLYDRKC